MALHRKKTMARLVDIYNESHIKGEVKLTLADFDDALVLLMEQQQIMERLASNLRNTRGAHKELQIAHERNKRRLEQVEKESAFYLKKSAETGSKLTSAMQIIRALGALDKAVKVFNNNYPQHTEAK